MYFPNPSLTHQAPKWVHATKCDKASIEAWKEELINAVITCSKQWEYFTVMDAYDLMDDSDPDWLTPELRRSHSGSVFSAVTFLGYCEKTQQKLGSTPVWKSLVYRQGH